MSPMEQLLRNIPAMMHLKADELVGLLTVLHDASAAARDHLMVACAKEGHKWDHPEGKEKRVGGGERYWEQTSPPCDLGDRGEGHWTTSSPEYALMRTCTRCGLSERGEKHVEVLQTKTTMVWKEKR